MNLWKIAATTLILIYVAMIGVVVYMVIYALVHFVLKFW